MPIKLPGPSLDKKDEHWSMIKHGDEGGHIGDDKGVPGEDSTTLRLPP